MGSKKSNCFFIFKTVATQRGGLIYNRPRWLPSSRDREPILLTFRQSPIPDKLFKMRHFLHTFSMFLMYVFCSEELSLLLCQSGPKTIAILKTKHDHPISDNFKDTLLIQPLKDDCSGKKIGSLTARHCTYDLLEKKTLFFSVPCQIQNISYYTKTG